MQINSHPTVTFSDLLKISGRSNRHHLSDENLHFTYSGRYALYQILKTLKTHKDQRNKVLVPAFHCPTLVEPVLRAEFTPVYYDILDDLRVNTEDVESKLCSNVAAVISVNYFGFRQTDNSLAKLCSERGIFYVEDAAHSFLSATTCTLLSPDADAIIYSFKKLIPTLNGGAVQLAPDTRLEGLPATKRVPIDVLLSDIYVYLDQAIKNSNETSISRKVYNSLRWLKHRWASDLRTKEYPEAQQRITEFEYPFDSRLSLSGISPLALKILSQSNLKNEAMTRRRNYAVLSNIISKASLMEPVFPVLGPDTVPWALPVLLRDRSCFDYKLREHFVPVFTFGETPHSHFLSTQDSKIGEFSSSRNLSKNLLCFPIHSGVSSKQIRSWQTAIAKVINDH